MNKITQEDLIRYLYNETSDQKSASIKTALQIDWNLMESYEKLLNSKKDLNKIHFSPRPESVNNILKYASKKQAEVTSS